MAEKSPFPKVKFFETPQQLRKWLEANHESAAELWVGFYKVGSGKRSVTWPQVVEESLCFGWIDGVRKRIDIISYTIRLTPRRPRSIWSKVNINLVERLISENKMRPAGLTAFERRTEDRSRIYSYERDKHKFNDEQQRIFESNKKAWDFFRSQPPWYQRVATYWVISAKKDETKVKRLQTLMQDSAAGRTIRQLTRTK